MTFRQFLALQASMMTGGLLGMGVALLIVYTCHVTLDTAASAWGGGCTLAGLAAGGALHIRFAIGKDRA